VKELIVSAKLVVAIILVKQSTKQVKLFLMARGDDISIKEKVITK